VIDTLTDGPKSVKDIARIAQVGIGSVYRPVRELVTAGWIEEDVDTSAFSREKFYKIKRSPNQGINLIVNVGGEQQEVSFNLFLETIASAATAGSAPKIAKSWSTLPRSIAWLAILAAEEMDAPGSVTESLLLEPRSSLAKYADILKEQLALVFQILNNDDFWDAKTLKNGTMLKTDRHLTPSEVRKLGRTILRQFEPATGENMESEILEGEVVR
jgi:hypothetical protein